jgi:hypothetical protein
MRELTIEEGTAESVAGCHCVVCKGIDLCAVRLPRWKLDVFKVTLSGEEADSAIRSAAIDGPQYVLL